MATDSIPTGSALIAEERARQIRVEGWSPSHDDSHSADELVMAACAYALPPEYRDTGGGTKPLLWPWEQRWWKPTPEDRIRELTKAGALIAAEIDRLIRSDSHSD